MIVGLIGLFFVLAIIVAATVGTRWIANASCSKSARAGGATTAAGTHVAADHAAHSLTSDRFDDASPEVSTRIEADTSPKQNPRSTSDSGGRFEAERRMDRHEPPIVHGKLQDLMKLWEELQDHRLSADRAHPFNVIPRQRSLRSARPSGFVRLRRMQ